MPKFTDRLQHAWNAFFNKDPTLEYNRSINAYYGGMNTSNRPDRIRLSRGNERTIVTAVYNRIALDVAATTIEHVRLDHNNRYVETIDSGLNECLTLSANRDQTGRSFIQDVVMSLFDEGCVAIVPTETNVDLLKTNSYDILSMRTGKIMSWYPKHVKVRVYNHGNNAYHFMAGDKVTQLVVKDVHYPTYVEVDTIQGGERGNAGYGSTGKR